MGPIPLLAIAASLGWAAPALAHAPDSAATAAVVTAGLSRWNLEPWLVWVLLLSVVLYGVGIARLWRQAGVTRGIRGWQASAFAGGWLALVAALVSPLDRLGALLFSAHMVQHEVLMIIAAPLLVLGRPLAAWTWAFAPAHRRLAGRATRSTHFARAWGAITQPLAAWALHALALWIWHVPNLFEAALHSEGIHVLQHASFLVTALLFWWAVLGADPRSRGNGFAIAYLFTTMLHTGALGALLALAPTPWYPSYAVSTGALGLDPIGDQQLGGLVMWVPGSVAYLIGGLVVVARLLAGPRACSHYCCEMRCESKRSCARRETQPGSAPG
jgi:putative membrane protein